MKEIRRVSMTANEVYAHLCELRRRPGCYAAYIRGKRCLSFADTMHEISAALQFPDYFGENPAALDECLDDLEWLCAREVVIFVDDAAMLERMEYGPLIVRVFRRAVSEPYDRAIPLTVEFNHCGEE